MAFVNPGKKHLNVKIVYYGPGLSGKTTNIQQIHARLRPDQRGKLMSLATQTDRTLFFDFMPVEGGMIGGYHVRFHLYTVPGQVFYNATRKMVLRGVDGVVFVADSQQNMLAANIESMANLEANLREYGRQLKDMPFVIQYNKRDLPGVVDLESLHRKLNPYNAPFYQAVATQGKGVDETLGAICRMLVKSIKDRPGSIVESDVDLFEPAEPVTPPSTVKPASPAGSSSGSMLPDDFSLEVLDKFDALAPPQAAPAQAAAYRAQQQQAGSMLPDDYSDEVLDKFDLLARPAEPSAQPVPPVPPVAPVQSGVRPAGVTTQPAPEATVASDLFDDILQMCEEMAPPEASATSPPASAPVEPPAAQPFTAAVPPVTAAPAVSVEPASDVAPEFLAGEPAVEAAAIIIPLTVTVGSVSKTIRIRISLDVEA